MKSINSKVALFAALAFVLIAGHAFADPTWGRPQPVITSTTISTSAPLTGGGDLSANRTFAISAATSGAAGSMSAADKSKLDLVGAGANTVGAGSSTDNCLPRFDGATGKILQASLVCVDDSDRVGLGTLVPTHTVTHASTSTGTAAYNTADQITNLELATEGWVTNEYVISTNASGSGTLRSVRVRGGPSGGAIRWSPFGSVEYSGAGSSVATWHSFATPTATSTSLQQAAILLTSTINQTGTGGYDGFSTALTLTAVGSGDAWHFRGRVGGADRFRVHHSGATDVDSTVTAAATTGNRTIDKPAGTVNIAAAGTTVTVTNSLISASTILSVLARTNDATCAVKNYVPTTGSVVINMTAACTAETSVGFAILDKN
jgi:hypothetical protein